MSKSKLLHIFLFIVTFVGTTLAGVEHSVDPFTAFDSDWNFNYTWAEVLTGLYYSIPFLGILTVHEFGHYFMAKYHKLKVTLPYYIPFWFPVGFFWIGTMGAVIRLKSPSQTKKQFFDVGIAGPLAGFVVALGVLGYGFTHLPPAEHLLSIHPEYKPSFEKHGAESYQDYVFDETVDFRVQEKTKNFVEREGRQPNEKEKEALEYLAENDIVLSMGKNLLFIFFEKYVVQDKSRVPSKYEMYHYPIIFAGFLALFFTALNLLPIGQLDGGHVVYGLLGFKRAKTVSLVAFTLFVLYAGMGMEYISLQHTKNFGELFFNLFLYGYFLFFIFQPAFEWRRNAGVFAMVVLTTQFALGNLFPEWQGYPGWLVFATLISRVLGIYHPQAPIEKPLDTKRKVLGWVSLAVFVLCFTPAPFDFSTP